MVPLFLLLKQMGLVNTYGGVIVPALASIFGIFLVRQYALSIPDDLLEAARIDGASEFRIFRSIVVPVLKPIIVTLGVFTLARHLERLHVAADRADRPRSLHAAGRARQPVARARAGQRADDGGLGAHRRCRCCWSFIALQRYYIEGLTSRQRQGMTARVKRASMGSGGGRRVVIAALAFVAVSHLPQVVSAADSTGAVVLDDFAAYKVWKAVASDGVSASIGAAVGPQPEQPALRLDFDLAGTAGYAIAQRWLPIELPANYEITFYVRADAPVNDFQVKLIDATGDNVWWHVQRNYAFPRDWQQVRIKKRQIDFAWGPTKDRVLKRSATLEFVVAAGQGGGKGSIYLSRLELRPLPPLPVPLPLPVASASSSIAGAAPVLAFDGDAATAWRSDPVAGPEQHFVVDFGFAREFGGLVLRWRDGRFASRYDVQFSDDGARWRTVRRVEGASGGTDAIALPEAETRYLRLALHESAARGYALAELEVKDLAFGASPNVFFQALARDAPRGHYPRGISGEQPSWTIVGVDGGSETALLSEDGALEVARGGFSIEPFIVADSKVVTWADVEAGAFPRRRRSPDARRSLATSAMGAARHHVRRRAIATRRGSSRATTSATRPIVRCRSPWSSPCGRSR